MGGCCKAASLFFAYITYCVKNVKLKYGHKFKLINIPSC